MNMWDIQYGLSTRIMENELAEYSYFFLQIDVYLDVKWFIWICAVNTIALRYALCVLQTEKHVYNFFFFFQKMCSWWKIQIPPTHRFGLISNVIRQVTFISHISYTFFVSTFEYGAPPEIVKITKANWCIIVTTLSLWVSSPHSSASCGMRSGKPTRDLCTL